MVEGHDEDFDYDVFLSHNSEEQDVVTPVATALRDEHGLRVWFDRWSMRPGERVVSQLEHGLLRSRCVAVFVGPKGWHVWHEVEKELALSEAVRRRRSVIPVLIGGATREQLPGLLALWSAVDFERDGISRLVAGIRGEETHGKLTARREPPSHAMLVYAAGDDDAVHHLGRDLLEYGVRPWLEPWDLAPSLDRGTSLSIALRDAPAVVICEGLGGIGAVEVDRKVLVERLERDRDSVHWIRLPGASRPAPRVLEGLQPIQITHEDWAEEVAGLAERIGIDRDRDGWLDQEASGSGVPPSELSPYRGLEPFRERDARWMFGRDREIADLVARIEDGSSRFVTVIGTSGSGKSSLVMAGVCPRLRKRGWATGRPWRVATMRPGARPCEALAHALVDLDKIPSGPSNAATEVEAVQKLEQLLVRNVETLGTTIERIVAPAAGSHSESKVLLVIDQLEELFTAAGLDGQDEQRSAQGRAFVRNLEVATRSDGPLVVVATLRADFTSHCLSMSELARILEKGAYFALPPMKEEQLRDAIIRPAMRVGFDVESRLVEKMVVGTEDQAGRLPLLQHLLAELWQRRDEAKRRITFDAYEQSGGLEGAIAQAAERALDELREELGDRAEPLTRRIMVRLVRTGETASWDTRRQATLEELRGNGDDEETRRVLEAFVKKARVLVGDGEEDGSVYEFAHEALLREWTTLVGWIDADRAALRVRQALAEDAAKREAAVHPREYLWGRGRIEEARRVLGESTVELNEVESDFLATSEDHAKKRSRIAWGTGIGVVAVLVGLLSYVGWLATDNGQLAREARELAGANEQKATTMAALANAQIGLRASALATAPRMDLEPLFLGIEAVAGQGDEPTVGRPPREAFQGLLDALRMPTTIGPSAVLGDQDSGQGASVSFSSDGSQLAVGTISEAMLWSVETGDLIDWVPVPSSILDIVFSPDGTSVVILCESEREILVWDLLTGDLGAVPGRAGVGAAAFSATGSRLATSNWPSVVEVWDTTSWELLTTLHGHEMDLRGIAYSPTDEWILATASRDQTARIWNLESGATHVLPHSSPVSVIAFFPDGTRVVTEEEGTVRVWDVLEGELLHDIPGHSGQITALTVSARGVVASASTDETVRLWDSKTNERLAVLSSHENDVTQVEFSFDGSRLVTGSLDGSVRLWEVETGTELATLDVAISSVMDVTFSPLDGRSLATVGYKGSAAVLWTIDDHDDVVASLPSVRGDVTSVAYSPRGTHVAVGGRGHVLVWNADNEASLWDLEECKDSSGGILSVLPLVFSPTGRLLAASCRGEVVIFDVVSGRPHVLDDHTDGNVVDLDFDMDDDYLAFVDVEGGEYFVELSTGEFILTVPPGRKGLEVHAESKLVVSWPRYSSLELYELTTGKKIRTFPEKGTTHPFSISPDGTRIIGRFSRMRPDKTRRESSLSSLDLKTGDILQSFEPDPIVNALAWSLDGKLVAGVDTDGVAHLWDYESGAELAAVRGRSSDLLEGRSTYHADIAFSGDGTRVVMTNGREALVWPIPSKALELACGRARQYVSYSRVEKQCARFIDGDEPN